MEHQQSFTMTRSVSAFCGSGSGTCLHLQHHKGDSNISFRDMHPFPDPLLKFTDIKNPCNHNHILFCEAVCSLTAMNF